MKTTKKRIALGAVGAIVAVGMFGACSDSTTPDVQSAPAASTAAAPAGDAPTQSAPTTAAPAGDAPTQSAPTTAAPAGDVPAEYASALAKARSYAENMHMSKAAVRDQLVSEYGESFPKAAADYAMANLTGIDWNANALAKAKSYRDGMHMSNAAIRKQLVSEYGEQFTAAEADYAMRELG